MSEKEVNDVILDAFEDLGIRGFRYIIPLKDNTLTVAKKQRLDGMELFKWLGVEECIYKNACHHRLLQGVLVA